MGLTDEEFYMCRKYLLVERRARPATAMLDWRGARLSTPLVVGRFRPQLFWPHLIFRMPYSHQPFIEPSHNIVEPLNPMPRLTRTRQFMRLARENYHCGRALQKLERAEELLSTRVLRSSIVGLS